MFIETLVLIEIRFWWKQAAVFNFSATEVRKDRQGKAGINGSFWWQLQYFCGLVRRCSMLSRPDIYALVVYIEETSIECPINNHQQLLINCEDGARDVIPDALPYV